MSRLSGRLPLLLLAIPIVLVIGRAERHRPRPASQPTLTAMAVTERPPHPAHPRLLLDRTALARLRDSAKRRTESWTRLQAACEAAASQTPESGYEGFIWVDAMADLALCWHGTGERRYAEGAVRYWRALLEDRRRVGDGAGGDLVIQHDSGYPIRTFGAFAALGYDWLHEAPTMTAELRQKAAQRLSAWIAWYGAHGYQHDFPVSNYFCGYLSTVTFAALAFFGETPAASGWLHLARDELLGARVLPTFSAHLEGGDWPEGWQYGELSAAELAMVATALRTATGVDLVPQLPWLAQVVRHHVHALVPGGGAVYDNGDWSEHPTKPSAVGLSALTFALEASQPARAAEARWMVRHAIAPPARDQLWLGALADFPGAVERDPRQGAKSLHAPGTGITFARSAWTPDAVWMSFQAGPPFGGDHQHADQGHFELFRGDDALLVDGGTYGSGATMSHNSLLVDDGGRVLNYAPNQGTWGRGVRTTRIEDRGEVLLASGDLTEAYYPACAEDGCQKRSVRSAVRTLVYVRPGALVIEDRVLLDQGGDGVLFAAHLTTAPTVAGTGASAVVGHSRVDLRTLAPEGASLAVRKEPTGHGDAPWRQNDPWGPMWRLEVATPRGQASRQLLHVLFASAAGDSPPVAEHVAGEGLAGARVSQAGHTTFVLFAKTDEGGKAKLPGGGGALVVAGLRPSAHYTLAAVGTDKTCAIEVRGAGRGGASPGPGGFLLAELRGCQVR